MRESDRRLPRRAFTVQEADALLPSLEEVLHALGRHREDIQQRHSKMQVLDVLWGGKLLDPGNPDHEEAVAHRSAILRAAQEIQRMIDEEIVARGIRFPQGGLEHGLLDFPTTWEGRWVYLCWRRGEASVGAWHEIGAGFAGRQPLTGEHAARMGREDDPEAIDGSALDF